MFVEALSFNLISIAQLCDLGLTCTFDKNGVVVTLEEDKSLYSQGLGMATFTWGISLQNKQAP